MHVLHSNMFTMKLKLMHAEYQRLQISLRSQNVLTKKHGMYGIQKSSNHPLNEERKPICFANAKTKAQNYEADQRLCFRYMGSTIPLLSKFKMSSAVVISWLSFFSSVCV